MDKLGVGFFLKMFAKGYEVMEFANMEYNDHDDISPAMKAMMNKDKSRTQPLVYKTSALPIELWWRFEI